MKHLAIALAALFALVTVSSAQISPDLRAKSDAVMAKMRQIDILNQVIPLVLTKEQVNKLLPVIEKARSKVNATQKKEAEQLEKLDSKLTAAIDKSITTGVPPTKELLNELAQMTMRWSVDRSVVIQENTDSVLKTFNEMTNVGQKKAAANSLAPQLLDPSIKVDKMTEEDKIRFFIQEILLDPQAYPILLRISKEGK